MVQMVGFRNIIIYEYQKLDTEILKDIAEKTTKVLFILQNLLAIKSKPFRLAFQKKLNKKAFCLFVIRIRVFFKKLVRKYVITKNLYQELRAFSWKTPRKHVVVKKQAHIYVLFAQKFPKNTQRDDKLRAFSWKTPRKHVIVKKQAHIYVLFAWEPSKSTQPLVNLRAFCSKIPKKHVAR